MMLQKTFVFFLALVNISFAEKETYDNGGQQKQQSMLRRHKKDVQHISTSNNRVHDAFVERQLKSSKISKSAKGTKSEKSSKSISKSNKSTKSSKSNGQETSPLMAPTIVAAYLEGIIASVVESNDFSSIKIISILQRYGFKVRQTIQLILERTEMST